MKHFANRIVSFVLVSTSILIKLVDTAQPLRDISSHNRSSDDIEDVPSLGNLYPPYYYGENPSFEYRETSPDQMMQFPIEKSVWEPFGVPLDGTTNHGEHGRSVSLSYNGKYAAVSGTNTVYIYRFYGGEWIISKDFSDMLENNGGSFYNSAISSDGWRVAIGVPNNDFKGPDIGSVQLFQHQKDDLGRYYWGQIGTTIYGTILGELFGHSLGLSTDGSVLVVGGYGAGIVKVYRLQTLETSNWLLLHTLKGNIEHSFGYSVAISGSGDTIGVGAPWGFNKKGYVRFFDVATFASVTQFKGDFAGDNFGYSVAISLDGSRAAAGAWKASFVRVYDYIGEEEGWKQLGRDIGEDEMADFSAFGKSISLSEDGCILVIGAPWYNYAGALSGRVRMYEKQIGDEEWAIIGENIEGTEVEDICGHSVSMAPNGKKVAIGCPGSDNAGYDVGQVRIYNLPASDYVDDDSSPSISPRPSVSDAPTTSRPPTESPVPTISIIPTLSDIPTLSALPTMSPVPTISLHPTISQLPTVSISPSISIPPTTSHTPTISIVPTITPMPSKSLRPSMAPSLLVLPFMYGDDDNKIVDETGCKPFFRILPKTTLKIFFSS